MISSWHHVARHSYFQRAWMKYFRPENVPQLRWGSDVGLVGRRNMLDSYRRVDVAIDSLWPFDPKHAQYGSPCNMQEPHLFAMFDQYARKIPQEYCRLCLETCVCFILELGDPKFDDLITVFFPVRV